MKPKHDLKVYTILQTKIPRIETNGLPTSASSRSNSSSSYVFEEVVINAEATSSMEQSKSSLRSHIISEGGALQ